MTKISFGPVSAAAASTTADFSVSGTWTWGDYVQTVPGTVFNDRIVYVEKPVVQERGSREEKTNMRGLFEVFVVNPETGDVDGPFHVIAKDEAAAKIKVVAKELADIDIDDFDIIVRRLGDVRPKKTVQTVKLAP